MRGTRRVIGRTGVGAVVVLLFVYAPGASFPGFLAAPRAQEVRGKNVFDKHCVECHGTTGRGDGPSAAFLVPRPRDFTTGKYKIRTTETGSAPTEDDLVMSVRRGLYGSSMPAWDRILSDAEITDVVEYLKALAPQTFAQPPRPVAIGVGVPSSTDSIARGRQVFEKLQCGKCHGTDGRGTGAVATTFEDEARQPLRAADLTEPWTFRGGATSRDVYLRFRTGMMGTPMPSFADAASDGEMWDLANFVVSLGRKPVWSMTAEEIAAFYARDDADRRREPLKRGEYLVETLGCAMCHSPVDAEKRVLRGLKLAGGMRIHIEPFGDFVTANLTSDKETGLADWSDDDIKRAITKGIRRNGSRLLPFPMDFASYSSLTADDLDSIVKYLRTVPAVWNKVPEPSWTFLPAYLWGKFKVLILGDDPATTWYPGNAGTAKGVSE